MAILALASGIAATSAIFSVVNAVLLRPLPYRDAGRIVAVSAGSPLLFHFVNEHNSALQDLAAYRFSRVNLTRVEYPEQIRSAQVTAAYFRLFGAMVARGRAFTEEECRPGGANVVVVGQTFWHRVLGGDSRVLGTNIELSGKPYQIVGIMASDTEPPASFDVNARAPDVWMPFVMDPASEDANIYFSAAARLKPGVSLESARAEMQVLTGEFRRQFPAATAGASGITVQSMRDALVGGAASSFPLFEWAVALVLGIACANVAGLLLVRSTRRRREIAIRAAMGARRGRIVRQLLTESLLLSAAGGVLGLLGGSAGIRVLLVMNAVSLPRIGDRGSAVTVDWQVLAFTALVSLIACVVSGLIPSLTASRTELSDALKGSNSRTGSGFWGRQGRTLLVFGEVAVAMVLLTGAGLLIRSWVALRMVDPGFDPHHVLTMRVSLAGARFQTAAAVNGLVQDSLARIGALPGVVSAASTCCLPLGDNLIGGVDIVGRPRKGREPEMVDVTTISPGYFDVLRIPLRSGRRFSDRDAEGATPVVIVSEALARRFWPGDRTFAAPLEASLVFPELPGQSWRIVGIAGDVRSYGITRNAPSIVYFPAAQTPQDLSSYIVRNPVAWSIRTVGESAALRLAIQKELSRATGGLAVSSVESMDDVLARSLAGREFNMWLLIAFGGAALLLASLGVYGLMAWSVEQRTQEIGIRMALGGTPGSLRNLVLLEGMRIAASGVAVGCLAAAGFSKLIAGFLFGVTPRDPVVLAVTPAVLLAVALFAIWVPARRATRIAPLDALRHG